MQRVIILILIYTSISVNEDILFTLLYVLIMVKISFLLFSIGDSSESKQGQNIKGLKCCGKVKSLARKHVDTFEIMLLQRDNLSLLAHFVSG